jgi:hypothetical protein
MQAWAWHADIFLFFGGTKAMKGFGRNDMVAGLAKDDTRKSSSATHVVKIHSLPMSGTGRAGTCGVD